MAFLSFIFTLFLVNLKFNQSFSLLVKMAFLLNLFLVFIRFFISFVIQGAFFDLIFLC